MTEVPNSSRAPRAAFLVFVDGSEVMTGMKKSEVGQISVTGRENRFEAIRWPRLELIFELIVTGKSAM